MFDVMFSFVQPLLPHHRPKSLLSIESLLLRILADTSPYNNASMLLYFLECAVSAAMLREAVDLGEKLGGEQRALFADGG